jgi:hypothetical protein
MRTYYLIIKTKLWNKIIDDDKKDAIFFIKNDVANIYSSSLYQFFNLGDSVDLKTAKIDTLCREGEGDIYRILV